MNDILSRLGVPRDVQEFFGIRELLFNYGGHFEEFDTGFHRVPTTPHLWLAGDAVTRELIVVPCAMEAIAYLTLNRARHPALGGVAFAAIGNLPHQRQLNWLAGNYPQCKHTMVFPNDLLGKLLDIRVATGLKNKMVTFCNAKTHIQVSCRGITYEFAGDALSLNAFEKAAAIRTGCRTVKPKKFNSFLEQLKHEARQ